MQVGGDSIDGKSVYLNHTFLYRLDSSILPPGRAYQTVTDWGGTDQLNTEYDQYLGNWAVYASRDLYRDGQVLAARGEKIAGSGFDSSKFGGNLFTVDADDNGKVTADATQTYLDLVSADNEHEAGWVLYLQCKRIAVADEVPNTWTETINGQPRESNKVVTKTPDMTPSIHLEKVDTPTLKQDGQEQADRDDPKQALKMDADNIGITFIITNTSKTDPATGDGAWFKASDLDLADSTIVGDAHVDMDSLTYPADWDTLVLKPGESVSVTGTQGRQGRRDPHGPRHRHRNPARGMRAVQRRPVQRQDRRRRRHRSGIFHRRRDRDRRQAAVRRHPGHQQHRRLERLPCQAVGLHRHGRARPCRRRSGGAARGRLPARVPQAPLRTGFRPPHGRERGQVTPWRSGLVVR